MARGQILTIPNQTGQLITTLSREQKASLSLLNPNDGVVYVKLNGRASRTVAEWDWKIPSQSYCQLPGPWESLGVYYLDQSGSGRTAEINVYELDSQVSVPSFIAIGRAVESAGSTMDISQGAQPANPPASTVRLWADGNGDLHIINSSGVDNLVYDSSNIGSVALGSDLYGTIADGHVGVRNTGAISAYDASNTRKLVIQYWSDNCTYFNGLSTGGTLFQFRDGNNAVKATLDGNGNLRAWGNMTAVYLETNDGGNGIVRATAGDLYVRSASNNIRMDGAGTTFMYSVGVASNFASQIWYIDASNPGSYYINRNGSNCQIVNLNVVSWGFVALSGNPGINMSWNGNILFTHSIMIHSGTYLYWEDGNTYVYGAQNSHLQFGAYTGLYRFYRSNWGGYGDFNLNTSGDLAYSSPWGIGGLFLARRFQINGQTCGLDLGRVGNEASTYTHTYNAGSHYVVLDSSATSYTTRSSIKYKDNISEFSEEECLARILHPDVKMYSYEHVIREEHRNAHENRPPDSTNPNVSRIGFIAEEMIKVVPEACATNTSDGSPEGIAYAELVTLVWGAVRQLNARIDKLERSTIAA